MASGGGRTRVEMELNELREKGLAKSQKEKYSSSKAAPLSTPEQAFAFLAAQKAAKKMKSKVEPPKNLNSNDLDSWFMQQRAQNAEMKRKRMEAAAILRGYRASSSGLENNDFTGSVKAAPSPSNQREVMKADAKSTVYGSGNAAPGKLVLPSFIEKEGEELADKAEAPAPPPALEEEEDEADFEDDDNLEELMKEYMDAKEAEGAPVPVNDEGEVDAAALLKEKITSDDVDAEGEEGANGSTEDAEIAKEKSTKDTTDGDDVAVGKNEDRSLETDDDLKEENANSTSDGAVGEDDTDVADADEDVEKDTIEKSNDASETEVAEEDSNAAAVEEKAISEKEESSNDVAPPEDEAEEDGSENVETAEEDGSENVGTAEEDASEGAADIGNADDSGASNEFIDTEGDGAAKDSKPEDEPNADELREENNDETEIAVSHADDSLETEEKKSDEADMEHKEPEKESSDFAWRERISSEEGAKFPPESGRYHLYASYACPWAHRSLMVWALKGLEDAISVTVVHPIWRKTNLENPDDQHVGWVFGNPNGEAFRNTAGLGGPFPPAYPGNEADPIFNAYSVRELYERADDTLGKYTLPLIWDKKLNTIVNNESTDIIRILNSDFNDFARNPDLDLYPKDQQGDIDKVNEWVHPNLNNAVYKCGFATSQEAYDTAIDELTTAFDKVDSILKKQKYITGDNFTEADVRLFVTLLRWDEVCSIYMKTNTRSVATTPSILNYCRDIYRMPGVAKTCHMDQIKAHYYCSHVELNRYSIIPRGSDFVDLLCKADD